MEGGGGEEGWGDEGDSDSELGDASGHGGEDDTGEMRGKRQGRGTSSREGIWESGKGRCAVTGRRLLGGTEGLRRVMA